MPLPKINTPTYELTLPSNGKKIKYRPFLVREEKILIMALETEDQKQITSAIIQILTACIMTRGVKLNELATFDIEYLFLNVRSKSVGETISLNLICPDDEKTSVEVSIDLDSIKVKKDKSHTNTIKLDDTLSMKMKYPSLDQFIQTNFDVNESKGSQLEQSFDLISQCIDTIYSDEEAWPAAESSKKELSEFLEQLNTTQFQDIENFFETMPKLSYDVKVTNPKTKKKSTVTLEGLASFFA